MIAEIQAQCINPIIMQADDTSGNQMQTKKTSYQSKFRKILIPINTFSIDTSVITGEPIFSKIDDSETVATDSIDALIESEKMQFQLAYKDAVREPESVDKFIQLAEAMLLKKNRLKVHAPLIAENYTKLLVKTVSKGFKSGDFKKSERMFFKFIEDIYPTIVNIKSTNMKYNYSVVASQGLIIAPKLKNKEIEKIVFDVLLGQDFDVATHKNKALIYNLACFYSLNKNKQDMLAAITSARKHGTPAKQFLKDSDFRNYVDDVDFIKALKK
jgi:hypothetical protein